MGPFPGSRGGRASCDQRDSSGLSMAVREGPSLARKAGASALAISPFRRQNLMYGSIVNSKSTALPLRSH
jgi:hypothetical protein